MASKKKSAPGKRSVKAKRTRTHMEVRIRKLESRLRELEHNSMLALDGVLVLEKGRGCRTLKVVGANLQIVNGAGKTDKINGCGNLIIGYNEPPPAASGAPGTRNGSHNLILGRYHSYASYAGLLSGEMNAASVNAPASCVVGGSEGSANADRCVIVGGHENKGNGARSVVIGGFDNGVTGASLAVVIGGTNNRADASSSSIFGGAHNTTNASAAGSTILGGTGLATNTAGERIPP